MSHGRHRDEDEDPYSPIEPLEEEDYGHGHKSPHEGATLINTKKGTWLERMFAFENFRSAVVVLVAVVACLAFTVVHEHRADELHLEGLTKDIPFTLPIDMTTDIVQMSIVVQDAREGHQIQLWAHIQGYSRLIPHVWKDLTTWHTYLDPEAEIEHHEMYDLAGINFLQYSEYRFYIETDSPHPLGISFNGHAANEGVRYQVIIAAAILVGLYVLIIFELVHRTIAAMLCAFIALAVVSQLHVRPTFEEVVSWIDFETIGLLFGMMIMVGVFMNTGFFEYSAVKAYKLAKGNLWHLTIILSTFTAIVSAFLDNVTTILLIGPVTIKLCKVLDIEPITILLCEVLFSNIGGTATIIGDPPNIIIANNAFIRENGVNFGVFSAHVAPGVVFAFFGAWIYIWKVYKPVLHRDPTLHLKAELRIWRKTLEKFRNADNPGEAKVRESLFAHITHLEDKIKESSGKTRSIKELEEKYVIRDFPLFVQCCVVLGAVVVLFFSHAFLHDIGFEISLAWIAVIGAMVLILVSGITHIEEVLEKVEFATLMFFAALFILMRSLEELGLIQWIGLQLIWIIEQVPEGDARLTVAILLLLWVSAFVSAFVDNIPYMATLVPIIITLVNSDLGLPLHPLVWAAAFGCCFGGNGTIIGASANVVAVGIAEHAGFHVRFLDFFKMGMPIMIITVFVAMIYMLVFHVAIPWY